jgi:hypothetical protein
MDTRSFRIVLVGLLVLVIGALAGVGVLTALSVAVPSVMADVVKVGLGGLMALLVAPPAADVPPARSAPRSRPAPTVPPAPPAAPPVSGRP